MKELKQTLDNLGFDTLPILSELVLKVGKTKRGYYSCCTDDIFEYNHFIRQPLALSQFVAMDHPETHTHQVSFDEWHQICDQHELQEHQKVVDAVIFESRLLSTSAQATSIKIGEQNATFYFGGDIEINGERYDTIESFINNGGKLKLK